MAARAGGFDDHSGDDRGGGPDAGGAAGGPGAARAVPRRAARLLLPHARVGVRRRRRRAGDAGQGLAGRWTGSRGAPRCAPGSTGSPPTSASTACAAAQRRALPMDLSSPVPATHRAGRAAAGGRLARAGAARATWCPPTPTRPGARCCPTPSGSPSSPRCRRCRRASGPSSSCARSCAGRPARWPSCSTPRSRRSTARCSGPAPRSATATRSSRPRRSPSPTAPCWAATSPRSRRTTSRRWSRCCTRTPASRCRRWRCGCAAARTCRPGTSATASAAAARGCSRPSVSTTEAVFGQYRPGPDGTHEPWALQVVELSGGRVQHVHHFLDPALFARFGLPERLHDEAGQPAQVQ